MSTYTTPVQYDKHVISELCALFMPMAATSYLALSTTVGRAVCCSSRCRQFINIGDFPSSSTLPSSMQDTEAANPYVNMIVCSLSLLSVGGLALFARTANPRFKTERWFVLGLTEAELSIPDH